MVAPGDVLTPEQAATLTFVPVEDFNGPVPPINYTVTDVNGQTSDADILIEVIPTCLLYTSPSPRDLSTSRMPSSA